MRVGWLAMAVLLAGCASSGLEPAREARIVNDPGLTWYLLLKDTSPNATLLFAPEASDSIAINFSCDRGSRVVEVETFNSGTDGTRLYLASGDVARTFAATPLPPDEFYGDAVVSSATAPVSDPVLAAFRASGAIAKGATPLAFRTATADELREIEAFFDVCEG
jgi:hypothetical protein